MNAEFRFKVQGFFLGEVEMAALDEERGRLVDEFINSQ